MSCLKLVIMSAMLDRRQHLDTKAREMMREVFNLEIEMDGLMFQYVDACAPTFKPVAWLGSFGLPSRVHDITTIPKKIDEIRAKLIEKRVALYELMLSSVQLRE